MASMLVSGTRLMSTSRDGVCTPFFIRSIRLVPPARNFAPLPPMIASIAACSCSARLYSKEFIVRSSITLQCSFYLRTVNCQNCQHCQKSPKLKIQILKNENLSTEQWRGRQKNLPSSSPGLLASAVSELPGLPQQFPDMLRSGKYCRSCARGFHWDSDRPCRFSAD